MKAKEKQIASVLSSFNRNDKDDWESIATEQHDENIELEKKLLALSVELKSKAESALYVDPGIIRNWKYSDRNSFEMGDVDGLAEDIIANGQLQPIIVRSIKDPFFKYEVIAGERRWKACKKASVKVWVKLTSDDDAGCVVIQTSENKKQSLSPYSLAKTYNKLMVDLSISQSELAKRLCISKSSFSDLMSFNKVPEDVWGEVNDMTNVSPRTAAFLSSTCSKGDVYINLIKNMSNKIREGTGADALRKYIDKHFSNVETKRHASSVYKTKDGDVIFRMTTEGRISLSKQAMGKVDLERLGEHLKHFFE
tara:strand:+ start:1468 stop:2394 length:927 start_codon:yes stop_codon:yes gene_type:complete